VIQRTAVRRPIPLTRYTAQSPLPPDGIWHFLTGVYTGSAVQLYIDGTLAASTATSGTIRTVSQAATLSEPTTPLRGDLDEASIWSRALTPAEISHFYSLGTT
jgi:hypothetical protein